MPGLAALNAGGNAQVLSVSCWRAGYCAAGGFYTRKLGYRQAFVVLEHGGRWGKAAEVPGSAALNAGGNAQVASVSCVSGGACLAGGYYTERGKTTQGFVVSERGGRWGPARAVPGLAALTPSGQRRAGRHRVVRAGLLRGRRVLRRRGVRGDRAGRPVGQRAGAARPGRAEHRAGRRGHLGVVPVSGQLRGRRFLPDQRAGTDDALPVEAFVVNHASGRWAGGGGAGQRQAQWRRGCVGPVGVVLIRGQLRHGRVPQPVQDVDCDPTGRQAGRHSTARARSWRVRETAAGRRQYVRSPGMNQVNSLSCTAAGDCSAGGIGSLRFGPAGVGGDRARRPVGRAASRCPASRSCAGRQGDRIRRSPRCRAGPPATAVPSATTTASTAATATVFVVSQRTGRWGTADQVPGTAALNLGKLAAVTSVSCTRPRACVGGHYTDRSGRKQAFVGGQTKCGIRSRAAGVQSHHRMWPQDHASMITFSGRMRSTASITDPGSTDFPPSRPDAANEGNGVASSTPFPGGTRSGPDSRAGRDRRPGLQRGTRSRAAACSRLHAYLTDSFPLPRTDHHRRQRQHRRHLGDRRALAASCRAPRGPAGREGPRPGVARGLVAQRRRRARLHGRRPVHRPGRAAAAGRAAAVRAQRPGDRHPARTAAPGWCAAPSASSSPAATTCCCRRPSAPGSPTPSAVSRRSGASARARCCRGRRTRLVLRHRAAGAGRARRAAHPRGAGRLDRGPGLARRRRCDRGSPTSAASSRTLAERVGSPARPAVRRAFRRSACTARWPTCCSTWRLRQALAAAGGQRDRLLVTAIANTAVNRRFTFGIAGRRHAVRHQLRGLLAFAAGAGADLRRAGRAARGRARSGRAVELAVLLPANLAATAAAVRAATAAGCSAGSTA